MKKALLIGSGLLAAVFAANALISSPLSASATTWGAEAALVDEDLTVEDMLTYALQDEYLALATYEAVVATYGEVTPFTRLIRAETSHVNALLALFDVYEIDPIVNEAASLITIPASLDESYTVLLGAEASNIAMYETFLAVEDLPADVAAVFTNLKDASIRHQTAGERILSAIEAGTYVPGVSGTQGGFGSKIKQGFAKFNDGVCTVTEQVGDALKNMFKGSQSVGRGGRR